MSADVDALRTEAARPGEPVDWGSLRRLTPVSSVFGGDRGQCIDRWYIEQFLSANAADVRGRVLEVAEDTYTRRFGAERVLRSDVLHVSAGSRRATIVADLANGAGLESDTYHCIILTQTLLVIYDLRAAIQTLHRILRPGGTVLATVPGISQISRYDMDRWGDYWRFTTLSAQRLFEEVFPRETISVQSHGNVLVAAAFLYGLAVEDLRPADLESNDPDYQLLITIRAVKPEVSP
ncbi:MAG TPA: methyltransferase domain-containing protein [Phycisphaerae bacterium]|nr:methyltransferase domain-containing protein [Phycisphaerae bacterium]